MDTEGIVIRIKTPMGDMDSSVDCPSLLSFNDLLIAIRDVMPEATVTAFEYEDEVGDRITVRSDEELKAMLSYKKHIARGDVENERALWKCREEREAVVRPITFAAGKTPGNRNIHGLKINEQDIQYQEQLGHGNGGTVYKAYHLLGKRVLAVKVIPLDITVELQKQIMSELEILYKCDSPYIIKFYSAFFVENRISICTEFMDAPYGAADSSPTGIAGTHRAQCARTHTHAHTHAHTCEQTRYLRVGLSFTASRASIQKNQGSLMPLQLLQCIVDEDHPFITQYDDGNSEVVSMWVCRSLEDRKSHQAQGLM
ncbi:dual specificity mitogen-activated protein kinase kinase 5 isoform X1 [Silurus asotus]|uniref:Dual specificity mitogen-activated protein kinase kinase 5 isoform X1 n=1 Tax=Silurus asotus TaxID=30991 RepID=A0AAD5B069_SILAS|nr:dual specificity mitogen-activated protein kinase kinase 5 isoform X1 [Silurus asotus]